MTAATMPESTARTQPLGEVAGLTGLTGLTGRGKKQFGNLPVKRLLDCLPSQGSWTMEDYEFFALKITEGPPLEFSHGHLVFKARPLMTHVLIIEYIKWELELFVRAAKLGHVYSEGAEFRCAGILARFPDVFFVSNDNFAKRTARVFPRVDLAIEVLSPSNRNEDLIDKRRDYGLGGVPEYWIVDPELKQITILTLAGAEYSEHGVFKHGEKARSVLLNGFEIDVAAAIDGESAKSPVGQS